MDLSKLYPSAAQPAPVAPVAPVESAPAAAPLTSAEPGASDSNARSGQPADTKQPATEQEPAQRTAASLYGSSVETRGHVDWREAAAKTAAEIQLHTTFMPHADKSPEGDAARAKLAEAFVAAGAGQTVARELFADAAAAAKPGYTPPSAAAAEAELRQLWGSQYETKINGAAELVRKAAAVDPSITEFLERTGLGNDPKFIRKVAARIAARGR